jgi:hypothetical protein
MEPLSPMFRSLLAFVLAPLVPVVAHLAYALKVYGWAGAMSSDQRPFIVATLLLAYASAALFAFPAYLRCARQGKTDVGTCIAIGALSALPAGVLIGLLTHGISYGAPSGAAALTGLLAATLTFPFGALSGACVWALRFRPPSPSPPR